MHRVFATVRILPTGLNEHDGNPIIFGIRSETTTWETQLFGGGQR